MYEDGDELLVLDVPFDALKAKDKYPLYNPLSTAWVVKSVFVDHSLSRVVGYRIQVETINDLH